MKLDRRRLYSVCQKEQVRKKQNNQLVENIENRTHIHHVDVLDTVAEPQGDSDAWSFAWQDEIVCNEEHC